MNSLPIQEPVFIFTIVMAVIFLSPYLMRLAKLPEIAGVIIFGVILGPNGLNILERDTGILLFGTVGILYIMFYSGLEIDLEDFKKKRDKSIVFGLLTFILPITAGILLSRIFLNFDWMTAILFGSLFSSHTLLTYPTVGKFGIKDNQAVVVAVGGTLITNAFSMLILAIISSKVLGGAGENWYNAPLLFVSFSVLVLILIPKFSRWFFRTAESETYTQYIFIITILFVVASVGKLLGVEPIIGAFLAGLAVNTIIPVNSILMNRIGFTGNTLFIPFFLMYVGMLTNVKLLFGSWETIGIAFLMFIAAVPTKYLAALITQKLFKYSDNQRELIFGLSNAQAANTLAALLVGVQIGLFPHVLLDAAVLLMLVTCIMSAIFTEKAARTISAEKNEITKNDEEIDESVSEKILLLLANPQTVTKLVDLSVMMKNPQNENPIFPLTLVVDNKDTKDEIEKKQKLLEQAQIHASGTNQLTHLITRFDVNVASGVKLATKEYSITHTVLGWSGSQSNSSKIFGTILDHILAACDNTIITAKSVVDWHVIERTILFISPNAHLEHNFLSVILPVLRVASSLKTTIILYGSKPQFNEIMNVCAVNNINLDIIFEESEKNPIKFAKKTIRQNDFSVIINGRRKSVSFNDEYEKIPGFINGKFPKDNFMAVYPSGTEKKFRHIANY